MPLRPSLLLVVVLASGILGCPPSSTSDSGVPPDAPDAGEDAGASLGDAGVADGGSSSSDAGLFDAGLDAGADTDGGAAVGPAPGFGALSGDCGFLHAELDTAAPSYFENAIDFADDPYDDPEDYDQLTSGGQQILDDGNAGGSSIYSEVFAFEVLARCEDAALLKTETFIEYEVEGKITDFLIEVDDAELGPTKVGVSVVRAVGFPMDDPYTVERATEVLTEKLEDVLLSSSRVSPVDAWVKQVLHVVAYGPQHAESMATAWQAIDLDIRADTVVIVTVTNGDDDFVY